MASKADDKKINVLPAAWSYPLLASWRTMEAAINPVFEFYLKCGDCGSYGQDTVQTVYSKKKVGGKPVIIGLQCTNCGQVLKFEYPLSPGNPDFPNRLLKPPASVVEIPGKPKPKASRALDAIKSAFKLD